MMSQTSRLDDFLFRVFRDSARRILWPVAGGDRFERFEECAALFTPEIKSLAVTALSTGDTRSLDDAVDRLLWNLHAEHGYDTAKPQWWTKEAGKVDVKKEKIRAILGQIEKVDPAFSRDAMPGRKADFQDLCKMIDRASFTVSPDTFSDYLPGLCAFQPGARKSDYYRDIAGKLG